MYVDGVANQRVSEVGLVLISPKKLTIKKSLRPGFLATNNEVEYETLLEGVSMVQRMGGKGRKGVFGFKIGRWSSRRGAKSQG